MLLHVHVLSHAASHTPSSCCRLPQVTVNETRVTNHVEAAHLMFENGSAGTWEDLAITCYKAATCERFLLKKRTMTKLVSMDPTAGHIGLTLTGHPLGLLVLDANPFDLAYKGGIRNGDVIVTINGRATTDHREAVDVISVCTSAGERVRITHYDKAAAAIELVITGTNFASLISTGGSSISVSSYTARGDRTPTYRKGGSFKGGTANGNDTAAAAAATSAPPPASVSGGCAPSCSTSGTDYSTTARSAPVGGASPPIVDTVDVSEHQASAPAPPLATVAEEQQDAVSAGDGAAKDASGEAAVAPPAGASGDAPSPALSGIPAQELDPPQSGGAAPPPEEEELERV